MRKSLKIAAIVAAAFLALGIVALAYAYSENNLTASGQQTSMQTWQNLWWSDNVTLPDNLTAPPCHEGMMRGMRGMRGMGHMWGNGFQWTEMLSQNATLSTVQGTVVTEVRDMLVLETSSGEIRVSVPRQWTVGSEVVSGASLFNGTFASDGQSVTVNVLENSVFSNGSFSINTMLAYEATNATGTQAYAVLPFNIQPSS
jgi:RNase P/RNase MRP subunit p29